MIPPLPSKLTDSNPLISVTVASDSSSTTLEKSPDVLLDSAYFVRIAPPLAMWMSLSITLILFNKFLYISVFRHPLSLTAVHMIFMTCVTQVLSLSGKLNIPQLGWRFYTTSILPLSVTFAISLASSNIAAQRLSVSFIQMIKAVTPLMTLAVCVFAGTERFNWTLVFITIAMTIGVGAASIGEIEFDTIGFTLQLIALTVESIRLVATQLVVQKHLPKPSNPLVALSLFAPPCAAILLPASLYFESGALAKLALHSVGPYVFANAVCALFLNFAFIWLASQESGPLTLTVRRRRGENYAEITRSHSCIITHASLSHYPPSSPLPS